MWKFLWKSHPNQNDQHGCLADSSRDREKKINQQSYNTWFKPTQLIKHDDRALYVRVPNAYFQDWLNEHIDVVLDAVRLAGIGDINVIYITEKAPNAAAAVSQGKLDFESIDNTLTRSTRSTRSSSVHRISSRMRPHSP
jgi:chromosomal replication initiation ATPase DnaA